MTDEKRKSFEKWARLMAISVRRMHGDSGDYEDADTRNAWHAWRNAWHASALAMRERAAQTCLAADRKSPDINGTAFYIATGQCAAAVRALEP